MSAFHPVLAKRLTASLVDWGGQSFLLSSFFLTNYNTKGAAPRGAAPFVLCVQSNLLGAVDTVAGIAQTGNDVAVLVQVVVLCAEVDIHIRVCLV